MLPKYGIHKAKILLGSLGKKTPLSSRNCRPHGWFQDRLGAGAGIYCAKQITKIALSVGKQATVFQAQIAAIHHCAMERLTDTQIAKQR